MTTGTNSLEREVETDLGKIEKFLGYNKGRKEKRMIGCMLVIWWRKTRGLLSDSLHFLYKVGDKVIYCEWEAERPRKMWGEKRRIRDSYERWGQQTCSKIMVGWLGGAESPHEVWDHSLKGMSWWPCLPYGSCHCPRHPEYRSKVVMSKRSPQIGHNSGQRFAARSLTYHSCHPLWPLRQALWARLIMYSPHSWHPFLIS